MMRSVEFNDVSHERQGRSSGGISENCKIQKVLTRIVRLSLIELFNCYFSL
jgi:hypothetical protein